MYKLDASTFYWVAAALQRMRVAIELHVEKLDLDKRKIMGPPYQKKLAQNLEKLIDELCILGCRMTTAPATELKASLEQNKATYSFVLAKISDIDSRMRDELSLVQVYVIDEKRHQYIDSSALPFGESVFSKFPSATFEIDEAGKCLAFARPTAAVFHLMRVMEIGLNAVAACLDTPLSSAPGAQNWGNMLRVIKGEMERRNSTKKWALKEDQAFFAENYASLDAVRVAWRNPTMHVANKYGEEEAENILHAVRGFMRNLASRMNEIGEPKA